ncbi:DUF3718 domain-containing protein [Ferrimonas lipolytica]|uniref:DUF3718 domain-containing protein n=1 Tax=Ferrimonas lipolytica TaxID=2724191 RepID=A0A6H1UD87_9GAMM|nr:DUF3718 domain-containing protein [Ferrimonas lipolytica]QIZ77004.1 DUF3718 domain-containing protein [Ferrimonas lipolytica]
MKALLLGAIMALGCSTMAVAETRSIVAADDSMETRVCVQAATIPMRRFSKALRHNRLDYKIIGKHLRCNNEAVATFAARYNSDDRVANRLARYSNEEVRTKVKITELASLSGTLVISAN